MIFQPIRILNSINGSKSFNKVNFFKPNIPISKFRLWYGFLICLFLSFFLYHFFILGRDLFRLLTFSDHFNYLELSENELHFYNLFYAFLALIMGQTYFLKIIFNTNKEFGEKRIQFKRKKIIHNQNIWIWSFFLWFFKLATIYGFLNMAGFGQKINYAPVFYEYFNFYEEYFYLFVLIVLVLFFQSWQGLGLTIQNYFRYLMGSFLFISMLAFAFTQINLINVEQYFKEQHSQNLYIKENIRLPKIYFTETLSLKNKEKEIFITKDSKIFYNQKVVDSFTLIKSLREENYFNYSINAFESFIQLNVDQNVSMKNLNKILQIIHRNTNYQVAFAAYPKDRKSKEVICQEYPVGVFENRFYNSNYENLITLHLTNENEILVNNNSISCNEIINTIAKKIVENQNYLIIIKLPENPSFLQYIQLLSFAKGGYFKACQIIGKEKGFDPFVIEYFPTEVLRFNSLEMK